MSRAMRERLLSMARRITIEKALAWALAIALAGVVCWMAAGTLRWGLVHDAPILHYIASRILAGDVPYRDLWDMNFPGTYLIHMFVLSVFGTSDAAWRAFDLCVLATIVALMVLCCRRLGWLSGVLGGSAFAAFHLTNGPTMMGQRDFLLVPLLLAAAYGVLLYRDGRGWALALTGLAAGAAVMIKPHAGVYALLLVVLVTWIAGRERRPLLRAWLVLGLAGSAPALLMACWLWYCGALPAFVELVFDYALPLYSEITSPNLWKRIPRLAERITLLWPLLPLAGYALVVVAFARRIRFAQTVLLIGLAYGIAHPFLQGKWWLYHVYPAAAFFCVATLSFAKTLIEHRVRLVRIGFLLGLALFVVNTSRRVPVEVESWIPAKRQRIAKLARHLRRELSANDTIQTFDTTAGGMHVLYKLGARQPTRFIYDYPIFAHDPQHPTVRAFRDELLRDMQANPPKIILVFELGWPRGGYERIEKFPALHKWIERNYRRPLESQNCRIYVRRPDRGRRAGD